MSRSRLLFVSPRFLLPMDEGGKIRTANILRAMKGGRFDVTLASPAPKHFMRHVADITALADEFVWWREQQPSPLQRLSALASDLPVAATIDRSSAGAAVVRQALAERPDVVVVDFLHTDVLLPRHIEPASVVFTHNVEAKIFERHASRTKGARRLVWENQRRKMARLEQRSLSRYDTVISVSDRDRAMLMERYHLPAVEVVDAGVDLEFFCVDPRLADPELKSDGGTLVFAANMGWAACVDGVAFLLDEVLPLLQQAKPRIRAIIIGRNPPPALLERVRERDLDVTFTGYVDDIRPYVAQADIYVIPLLVGSGTRIKVFEAMAMGCPIVSTSLGVEGLNVTDPEHFLRADDGQTFANNILTLLDNPSIRIKMARAARRLMEERFSWLYAARQFEAICERTLARATLPPSRS